MSNHNTSTHSHHHHHSRAVDDASEFKNRSLNSIQRRKMIAKWAFRLLILVAVLMAIATVWVYRTE